MTSRTSQGAAEWYSRTDGQSQGGAWGNATLLNAPMHMYMHVHVKSVFSGHVHINMHVLLSASASRCLGHARVICTWLAGGILGWLHTGLAGGYEVSSHDVSAPYVTAPSAVDLRGDRGHHGRPGGKMIHLSSWKISILCIIN